ncbi:DNA mismatch repair protein MutS [Mycobacterium sp. KBS0706]|nr:DNA mismatch repair protein MutS [Mycobacterium sp. KBS0706]
MAKTRKPSEEERRLWRLVTQDVAPLRPTDAASSPPPPPEAPSPPPPRPAPPGQRPAATPKPTVPAAAPKRLHSGDLTGIDGHRADRLRRGKQEIEGRLDLHGMRQVEAHDALIGFVASAQRAGKKTLLVITGKGSFSNGDSVLRANVPLWLNEPPLRDKILAITPAHPRDGGSGALYVVLKRRREG